jgi:hypothetical protein
LAVAARSFVSGYAGREAPTGWQRSGRGTADSCGCGCSNICLILLVQVHHAHAVISGARLEAQSRTATVKLVSVRLHLLLPVLLLRRLLSGYLFLTGTSRK